MFSLNFQKLSLKTPIYFTSKLDRRLTVFLTFNVGKLLPSRVSNRFTTNLIVDLLLLRDGSKNHYVLIRDLLKLMEYMRHTRQRLKSEI